MYPQALKEKGHTRLPARYNPFKNLPKVEVKWGAKTQKFLEFANNSVVMSWNP
jgi:hypothetical protein